MLLHGDNDEIVPLDHFPQDLLPLSIVAAPAILTGYIPAHRLTTYF